MEMRNGVYTSRTKADDAKTIERLAKEIAESTSDASIQKSAEKIQRLARALKRELA